MNREQIIYNMCMTFRHDYGLEISEDDRMYTLNSGMTRSEREELFHTMAQVFDHNIAPLVDSAIKYEAGTHCPIPQNLEQAKGMMLIAENYLRSYS
jgi:hypothetical protein